MLIGPRHDLLEALGLRNVLLRRPRRHAREDGLERGHVRRRLRRALRQLLHLALGLLGPLFHGLDLLLVRDDLVVVFRMTLAKLLELRFPLVKHLLALLQQPARLGELRLEVRDLLLGRGRARLKILDLALGRGRAGLGGDNYSIFAVGVASGKSPDVSTGVSPTRPEGGVTGRRV